MPFFIFVNPRLKQSSVFSFRISIPYCSRSYTNTCSQVYRLMPLIFKVYNSWINLRVVIFGLKLSIYKFDLELCTKAMLFTWIQGLSQPRSCGILSPKSFSLGWVIMIHTEGLKVFVRKSPLNRRKCLHDLWYNYTFWTVKVYKRNAPRRGILGRHSNISAI